MSGGPYDELRVELQAKKQELLARLERISANLQRGFNADSKEMAKELEDSEVVDALGNEARVELTRISSTLTRLDSGRYGTCSECGEPIGVDRLKVYPYADECIECATFDERRNSRM